MRWLDSINDSVDMSLSKLGDSEGQRSLVCCSPQGRKELDATQPLKTYNHLGSEALGHWTTREVPPHSFVISPFQCTKYLFVPSSHLQPAYVWTLHSIILVCLLFLPHCFNYCDFVICLNIWQSKASTLALLFLKCLKILRTLIFHVHLRISL